MLIDYVNKKYEFPFKIIIETENEAEAIFSVLTRSVPAVNDPQSDSTPIKVALRYMKDVFVDFYRKHRRTKNENKNQV